MNIDPKVEPWLRALLDGVENSNHRAETIATEAYASDRLVKALEDVVPILPGYVIDLRSDGLETFGAKVDGIAIQARAALALAKGDAA